MARTVGAFNIHSLPSKGHHDRIDVAKKLRSTARRVAEFVRGDRARDAESFIRQRGGVMSDDVERELIKRYGAM
jgi:hypothetical protein